MSSVKDKRVSSKITICEVHRELYDRIMDSNMDDDLANQLITLLEDAYIMAKKMNNKLVQYKNNWDDEWWENNRNFEKSWKKRMGKNKKPSEKKYKIKKKNGNG